MGEIAELAKELAGEFFHKDEPLHRKAPLLKETLQSESIEILISEVEIQKGVLGARLRSVCKANRIKSIGDLLHIGRKGFKTFRNIGVHTIETIDKVLEEYYSITEW